MQARKNKQGKYQQASKQGITGVGKKGRMQQRQNAKGKARKKARKNKERKQKST